MEMCVIIIFIVGVIFIMKGDIKAKQEMEREHLEHDNKELKA